MRTKRPAPTSSTSESATCPTTRDGSNRDGGPLILASAFRTVEGGAAVACSAGAVPKPMAVAVAAAAVKPSTRAFGVRSSTTSVGPVDRRSIRNRPVNHASTRPRAAPSRASSVLSISHWRAIRNRPAPMASRTAISRCRADARASSRLATFAQAINSTNPTAPNIVPAAARAPDPRNRWVMGRTAPRHPRPGFGSSASARSEIACTCDVACSIVYPGFSLATVFKPRHPRSRWLFSRLSGVHTSIR